MLDIRLLRQDTAAVAQNLARRGFVLPVEALQSLEAKRRVLQQDVENNQAEKNRIAANIGKAKKAGEPVDELTLSSKALDSGLAEAKIALEKVQLDINEIAHSTPNLLDEKVPDGKDDTDNFEVSRWGTPREFNFPIKDHIALGEMQGDLDFASARKLSGARFSVLRGRFAKLHRALSQFMLDLHAGEHGYEELIVPYLVNQTTLFGTGQLPKFGEDLFKVENGDEEASSRDFYLIPTSEVPLTNLVSKEVLPLSTLPLRFVAHTPCFRSEAGNSGKDIAGLIRQHQFEKVELVQIVHPEKSWQALEEMATHAEKVLQMLELPYRRLVLCAGDTGFCSTLTYDLEVWVPSQDCYREISSLSNCLDFQARRMLARFRPAEGAKPELVHTLNGSGVAVGRALLAVVENHQQEDGSIVIPKALRPYLNNQQIL